MSASTSTSQTDTSSFPTSSLVIPNIFNLVPIRHDNTNYLLWKSLFEPILRGHRLMSFIDGSKSAPSTSDPMFETWYEHDQMLLSWIQATLSTLTLLYMVGIKSSKEAWDILECRYASSTPMHITSLRKQLHRLKKGSLTMHDYFQQVKSISDQLAGCGAPISDDELQIYILDGLPSLYHPFASIIHGCARIITVTLEELHDLLICEEMSLVEDASTKNSHALVAAKTRQQHSHHPNSSNRQYTPQHDSKWQQQNAATPRPSQSNQGRHQSNSS
ncbi:PREDICTED: uncharacterized protein LOC104602415 [Nelumbo nucifera]|uniref:Uncharacterized protein LOC104602415 n=1 Tax=Nelumbo nucifera TaxID=4432 RepID=A0A1U8AC32_NELNU|nr:PREDICTED: uncharacterized protein LOC104602415 [Nelumbo nucifera]